MAGACGQVHDRLLRGQHQLGRCQPAERSSDPEMLTCTRQHYVGELRLFAAAVYVH